MPREMVDFFCAARREFPILRFLILTQSSCAPIEAALARRNVDPASYRCLRVSPEEIPAHLAAADFAISFVAPSFSKIASSPTKMGEYLAAGLPVVFNAGVGDLDDLKREGVGAVVESFTEADYAGAARQIRMLLEAGEATAHRCRAAAEKYFSLTAIGIPRYLRLYDRLIRHGGPETAAAAERALGVDGASWGGGAR